MPLPRCRLVWKHLRLAIDKPRRLHQSFRLARGLRLRRSAWRAARTARGLPGGLPSSPAAGVRVRLGRAPSGDTGEVRGGAGGWARVNTPQINLSVIVMLVTGTGDKVVYRIGRSKGRSRTPTLCRVPTSGYRGDRSQICHIHRMTWWRMPSRIASLPR